MEISTHPKTQKFDRNIKEKALKFQQFRWNMKKKKKNLISIGGII